MFHHGKDLRYRLMLVAIAAALPILAALLFSANNRRAEAVDEAQDRAFRLAQIAAARYEQTFESARQFLHAVSRSPHASSSAVPDCRGQFEEMLQATPMYIDLGIIGAGGGLLCSAHGVDVGESFLQASWYQHAMMSAGMVVSECESGAAAPVVYCAYPFLGGNGARRVVYVAMDLYYTDPEATQGLPEGTAVTVVDRNGRVIFRSVNRQSAGDWIGHSASALPVVDLALSQRGGTARGKDLDGVERLFAFTPLSLSEDREMYVIAGTSSDEAMAGALTALRANLLALMVALVIAQTIAWIAGDFFVTRAVRQLAATAKRLGDGDMSARPAAPVLARGDEVGALARSLDAMAHAIDTRDDDVRQAHENIENAYDQTIEGWAMALDLRDPETVGHTRRVTELTVRVAERMGLPEHDVVQMRRGAMLHDIGKMGVPDSILLKPGPLTDEEWRVMKTHPTLAFQWLSHIDYLRPALVIPHYHHERWNGSGYPHGLAGTQIPLAARIFAVVDVWDASTTDRPYRNAWPCEQAAAFLREKSGELFDARVVEVLLDVVLQQNDDATALATPATKVIESGVTEPVLPAGK